MSSDHPFDKQMKTSFDGFEPNVHANWAEFERSLEPTSSAPSQSSSTLNRWAVATAVAAGGALMWVAKPLVQDLMVEEGTEVVVEMNDIEGEHPQTFDEAWEEFTNVTQGFVEDVMDAEAEAALLTEASEKAAPLKPICRLQSSPQLHSSNQPHLSWTTSWSPPWTSTPRTRMRQAWTWTNCSPSFLSTRQCERRVKGWRSRSS